MTDAHWRAARWGVLAAALAMVALLVQDTPRATPQTLGLFRVREVLDGDTVVLEGCNIYFKARLAGIDAPERGWKNVPGQPYARRSREYLSSLIRSRDVEVRQVALDDYNRPLVFLRCGDADVNLRMVEQGMAEAYRGRTEFDVRPFFQAEERARRQRLNIWSLKNYESPRRWRGRRRQRP
ncbi:MAG: thermonuclease family protein [Deltaproteobacteria bacterium]|nr:thermonuclease family protein [Deltaproteobacteria bacterium]MBW2306986.1 thermonuclease family protein [Deltaproteobacteria bacterium]